MGWFSRRTGRVWLGMTTEQLIDTWGRPEQIRETVSKAGKKQTWVYGCDEGQYRQRIIIENDRVVGWRNQGP